MKLTVSKLEQSVVIKFDLSFYILIISNISHLESTSPVSGRELVTRGHLSYYLMGNIPLDERMTRVEKLHYVLELLAMLHQYLELPKVTLGKAVR